MYAQKHHVFITQGTHSNPIQSNPTQTSTNHSFAASLTSPIFNFGEYFFSTFSLWYWRKRKNSS